MPVDCRCEFPLRFVEIAQAVEGIDKVIVSQPILKVVGGFNDVVYQGSQTGDLLPID